MIEPDQHPTSDRRNAAVAVIGAGTTSGPRLRFAREGYIVFAGRRNGDKLAPLVKRRRSPGS